MRWLDDDKNLVIIAVSTIALGLIFWNPLPAENASILNSIISGLFGIAVGRGMNKSS